MSDEKKSRNEKLYEIPYEGSLGLLALGARGIEMWRKKKAEVKAQQPQEGQKRDEEKK